MARPYRLSDEERQHRGTWRPDRVRLPQEARSDAIAIPLESRPYAALAARYCADVLAGKLVTNRWTQLACARQKRDLDRDWAADPTWPYVYRPDCVEDVCAFVEQLPHVEGRWKTPTLFLEPAQLFLLGCLFGWRLKADPARRRFTTVYWEMGRKGAKSTLMAAIGLYHLLEEGEPGPQVICGATTGSQARIVFDIAARMVKQAPWLRARGLAAYEHGIRSDDGTMKPINAKASTQDGLNPSCIILDESHAQAFKLHDVLKSAQGARPNPLLLCPTTAGYDLLSVGYALRTTLIKVLEGSLVAEHFLGVIYGLDEGDDWRDEHVWAKANPMLGVGTPLIDQVRRHCVDAQQTPGLEGEFRVKVCSEWLNAATTWLSLTAWDRCAEPTLTLEQFTGARCWIGGDLAQRDDLAAVALLFERDNQLVAFIRCYLPGLVVQERAQAVPEYRSWVEQGLLIITDGDFIDYARIERDVRDWCKQFAVQDIAFDDQGAIQLVGNLYNEGLPARTERKNAKSCTPPIKELEARVMRGRFRHDGNSCLRWQVSNVVMSWRDEDSRITQKPTPDSPHKIDAVDALLWSIGGWLRVQTPTPQYQIIVA